MQVSVVVMITSLVEGPPEGPQKKKADQYWPDKEDPIMELGNGVILEHLSSSYLGTYFCRSP